MGKPLICLLIFLPLALASVSRPNIVIFLADDLGYNDVSFHGSNEFLTPNIDALAYNGIILNRFYVPPMCTPSRAALMTGKHPIHLGMQHYVIPNDEPWGLPLEEKTIAQVFKEAGYRTSLIGKWHLGFAEKAYTPLFRGFDQHFGYLGGYIDYYDQTLYLRKNYSRGHDFRNNLDVDRSKVGKYLTDTLTDEAIRQISTHDTNKPLFLLFNHLAPHTGNDDKPLQAPEEEIEKFNYIQRRHRRTYAAMVSKMDTSIGQVIKTLDEHGLLDNTIVIFYSDNGAPTYGLHSNTGDNYPFRGQKNSPWEGAIRAPAIIWSKYLGNHGQIWDQHMHAMDWLPTLATAAGLTLSDDLKLDGMDFWEKMRQLEGPAPRQLVHNIDDITNYASYSSGDWKYVNGTTLKGKYDGWLQYSFKNSTDPRANVYDDTIRQSLVWTTLERYYDTHQINIEDLRSQAQVKCISDSEVEACHPLKDDCIFNLRSDPCEQKNLNVEHSPDHAKEALRRMRIEVEQLRRSAVPPRNKPTDPNCDPRLHDFEWTWWKDVGQQ